ncbi:MAG: phage major capsid protein [Clostridia bacterium]
MPIYNGIINRTGAESLVPQPVASEIFQGIAEESAMLSLARRLPDMTSKTLRLPVLNSLPTAYFVNGDTGLKETSNADWTNKTITAEELAVIIPVPDAVIDDAGFDIWAQIKPLVVQAFGKVIDQAMLYGTNKPTTWPDGIVTGAGTAGNTVVLSAAPYADIMAKDGLIAKVEQAGYMVGGYIGAMAVRGILRGVIDTSGQPIFRQGMTGGTAYMLDGQSILFPKNGAIDATKGLLVGGDFRQMVYSIRQDLTVKRATEAVITDATGKVIYNLLQQDMTALRFVMRLGWQLPNPKNNLGGGAANQYPFAVLMPKVGV